MEKIWLQSYQEGVSTEFKPLPYNTLVDLFEQSCNQHADKIAYSTMGSTLSYKKLQTLSEQLAAFLQSKLGVNPGIRVAIMLPNTLQYPVSLFAILTAGFIVVNVNPLYTVSELTYQLNDSGAEAIICLANMAHIVEQTLSKTQIKTVIVTEIGDLFPFPKNHIVNFIVKHIKPKIRSWNISDAIGFKKALQEGATLPLTKSSLVNDDIALLQYTGGTTGISKGAMLTHKNLLANIAQMHMWLKPSLMVQNLDIIATPLPLYHIFSLTVNCLTFLPLGSMNILITNPRDITDFIKHLHKVKFTVITGVNTLFNALLEHPHFPDLDFSKLKFSFGGGMSIQQAVAAKWQVITACPLLEGYGLTEASPVVAANPLNQLIHSGGIGLPMPGTEISICDEQGDEVVFGEVGELWVRGPQVMKGYWQNPSETAKVLTEDGWLRTGDLVKIDAHGYLYFIDRIKDMINISGLKVYPQEVEAVIAAVPGVLDVAIVGVTDGPSGEIVKAYIVKSDPKLQQAEIIKYCYEQLARYKVPKSIEFCTTLPKSNLGKILKRELR